VDTEDTDYDTVLRHMDGCGGVEIACDDDGGSTSLTSSLQITVAAGDTVYISLDAYSSSSYGTFVLDINEGC